MWRSVKRRQGFAYTGRHINAMNDKRTILIAGIGTSPAILTETVWSLAHAPIFGKARSE